MFGYIYITTNIVNNKKYIGQKKGNFNPNYKGSGVVFKSALKKYGKENFIVELIENVYSEIQINDREKFWIKQHNAVLDKNYYNLGIGGKCWNHGIPNPNMSKRMLANNPMKDPNVAKKSGESKRGKSAKNKITETFNWNCKWCDKLHTSTKTVKNIASANFCNKSCAASFSNTYRYKP